MPALAWRTRPARSMSRCEMSSASFGSSRRSGRKYRLRRIGTIYWRFGAVALSRRPWWKQPCLTWRVLPSPPAPSRLIAYFRARKQSWEECSGNHPRVSERTDLTGRASGFAKAARAPSFGWLGTRHDVDWTRENFRDFLILGSAEPHRSEPGTTDASLVTIVVTIWRG